MIRGGEKCSGCLSPKEEKLLSIWLGKAENSGLIRSAFATSAYVRELKIVPFDLEDVFLKSNT